MNRNTSHLVALSESLSRLKTRYAKYPTALNLVWIQQIEREIASEMQFLGMSAKVTTTLSDDELLAELQ